VLLREAVSEMVGDTVASLVPETVAVILMLAVSLMLELTVKVADGEELRDPVKDTEAVSVID
jgi:hypothetical protein